MNSTAEDQAQCPLCGHSLKNRLQNHISNDGRLYCPVECVVCGKYSIDELTRLVGIQADLKSRSLLSAIVRRHYEFTGRWKSITQADCAQLPYTPYPVQEEALLA